MDAKAIESGNIIMVDLNARLLKQELLGITSLWPNVFVSVLLSCDWMRAMYGAYGYTSLCIDTLHVARRQDQIGRLERVESALAFWAHWSSETRSCGQTGTVYSNDPCRNLLDKVRRWMWRDSTLVVLVHHSSFSVLQDDNAFCCRLFSDNQLRKWYSHVCTYHTTFQMKLLWILMGVHDEVCNHTATGSTSKWRNSQQQIASIFFSIPNYYIQYHMRRVSHYYYTLFLLTFSLHTYVHT